MKMRTCDFVDKTSELMQKLWKLAEDAEQSGNNREAWLLTVAGNIVEHTFCTNDDIHDVLNSVMNNADDCVTYEPARKVYAIKKEIEHA